MNAFAIVTEGITDYEVLKNILLGWFRDQEIEPVFNLYQPNPTATGDNAWQQFGCWENVLKYLEQGKHRDALEYADYLVVQIDTDQSEHVNFGVSQRENNQPLEPHDMVERVVARLREIIGGIDVACYGDRIIFAICVREIECWILPLWDPQKADKCEGCTIAMDRALSKANQATLNKDPRRYAAASRGYRRRSDLLEDGSKNPSLKIFLGELERRQIVLSEQ
jgi:hypothetical protein